MRVLAIGKVAALLDELVERGVVQEWELPYENLITRLDAAIFFVTPSPEADLTAIWSDLNRIANVRYEENEGTTLSELAWRVQFAKPSADKPNGTEASEDLG